MNTKEKAIVLRQATLEFESVDILDCNGKNLDTEEVEDLIEGRINSTYIYDEFIGDLIVASDVDSEIKGKKPCLMIFNEFTNTEILRGDIVIARNTKGKMTGFSRSEIKSIESYLDCFVTIIGARNATTTVRYYDVWK